MGAEWLLVAAPLLWLVAVCVQETHRWLALRRPADWLAAEAQAEALLHELLGAAEYQALAARGYLCIPSRLYPERHYRVYRPPRLVEMYERGQRVAALCLQPTRYLPSGDRVLLHKLLLEGDEARYLRIARVSRPGRLEFPPRPRGPLLPTAPAPATGGVSAARNEAGCAPVVQRLY
ncbi:MAG: hypothetical protein IRZ14_05660 [Chloroflexi bacterium]|nr:hypothetical protein [Chloroflexota bacterium]